MTVFNTRLKKRFYFVFILIVYVFIGLARQPKRQVQRGKITDYGIVALLFLLQPLNMIVVN